MGSPTKLQQRGIQAAFSSETTQAECSPLNRLHSAGQRNQYYTVKQVIFTAHSMLQLLL